MEIRRRGAGRSEGREIDMKEELVRGGEEIG